MKGLRFAIDIKKSDEEAFIKAIAPLIQKRIIKTLGRGTKSAGESRLIIDIKQSDEKAFIEAIHPLVQKGIVKTENVHSREQEI